MSDRRNFDRIHHELSIYIPELNEKFVTSDISPTGCSIKISEKHQSFFEGKEDIEFEIELPNEKKISVKGTVKYIKNGQVGIEFVTQINKLYFKYLETLQSLHFSKEFFRGVCQHFNEKKAKKKGLNFGKILDNLKTVGWVLLFLTFFWTALTAKVSNYGRERILNEIEKQRNTQVITLIHRMETIGFLGIPVKKYIQVEDAEAILTKIRDIPDEKPIDMILHTPGGVLLPAYQIAQALKKHKGKVTVFIPFYAMSGGTLIALAADEIVMAPNAVLGPVDPQMMIGKGKAVAAVSVVKLKAEKGWDKMSDEYVILCDQAEKAIKQVKNMVRTLLSCSGHDKTCPPKEIVVDRLVGGHVTHDYPIFYTEAKNKLQLPVSTDMPKIIYKLMKLYKSPTSSVSYSKVKPSTSDLVEGGVI